MHVNGAAGWAAPTLAIVPFAVPTSVWPDSEASPEDTCPRALSLAPLSHLNFLKESMTKSVSTLSFPAGSVSPSLLCAHVL